MFWVIIVAASCGFVAGFAVGFDKALTLVNRWYNVERKHDRR